MKVIDLLNKIANGEEVPKKIKFQNRIYEYQEDTQDYFNEDLSKYVTDGFDTEDNKQLLNFEVEIIEEPKEIKLPDKLNIEKENTNYFIKNEFGTKCGLTKHSKMIAETLNQVIDYLKSKEME